MEGKERLSRRHFLGLAAGAAVSAGLAACAAPTPEVVERTVEVVKTVEVEVEKTVEVEKIVEVEGETLEVEWYTGMVPTDTSGEFKMMSWEGESEMRKFLPAIQMFFETYYPNMTYEIEWGVPWSEYWTKLPTLLAGGTPPDLAWQHQSRGKVFTAKGWSMCMDDWIAAYPPDGWPDDWSKASLSTMMWRDKVYALPYDWCGRGLFVNRDIMDDIVESYFGEPYPVPDNWTWDDYAQLGKLATQGEGVDKQFGMSYSHTPMWLWGLVKGFGGRFFDEGHNESFFTDAAVFDAVQWEYDRIWKDKSMPTEADFSAIGGGVVAFASHRLAMFANISGEYRHSEEFGEAFRWGVYPLPLGPGGRVAFEGNSGWFVPTGSKYPDMAYELTRYALSNPELLPTYGLLGVTYCGRPSFWKWGMPKEEDRPDAPNYEHVFMELPLEDESAFPWWEGYQEWEPIYNKWLQPVLVEGDPNIADALEGLRVETNEFLKTGWWREV